MVEALPKAFYCNRGGVRRTLWFFLILTLLINCAILLIYPLAMTDPNGTVRAKGKFMALILPMIDIWFLGLIAELLRLLIRNPPILTILPEGLLCDAWGLLPWSDIHSVEVQQVVADAKTGWTYQALLIGVANLKSYAHQQRLFYRAVNLWRDCNRPLRYSQGFLAAPVFSIAAAIEAHCPKAPAP